MSDYTNVERPFLKKLDLLGWKVINHSDASTYCSEINYGEYLWAAEESPGSWKQHRIYKRHSAGSGVIPHH
jgi:hypothetical protein